MPELPRLTFSKQVAEFVRLTYASAQVILEYGSGGSTFAAALLPGKRIVTVESDPAWANRMRKIAAQHTLPSPPIIIYADIGPVERWGRAVDHQRLNDFFLYAHAIWDDQSSQHPDVVLVDGRFRAACFMAAYINSTHPVTVLFDDYRKRKEYHVIERLVKPVRMIDRMAVFHIHPDDRAKIPPWLLVATYFDAVCSFKVRTTSPAMKFHQRIIRAVRRALGLMSPDRHSQKALGRQ